MCAGGCWCMGFLCVQQGAAGDVCWQPLVWTIPTGHFYLTENMCSPSAKMMRVSELKQPNQQTPNCTTDMCKFITICTGSRQLRPVNWQMTQWFLLNPITCHSDYPVYDTQRFLISFWSFLGLWNATHDHWFSRRWVEIKPLYPGCPSVERSLYTSKFTAIGYTYRFHSLRCVRIIQVCI